MFAAGAAILSGVLVTIPALFASGLRAGRIRVDSRRMGRDLRTSRLRAVLVSAEFALALPLVACAFWFVQSDLAPAISGSRFRAAGAVTMNVELAGPRYADGKGPRRVLAAARGSRAVSSGRRPSAGIAANMPPEDADLVNNFDLIDVPARGGAEPTAPWNVITPGFLEALGVRLLEGRDFTPAEYASGTPAHW